MVCYAVPTIGVLAVYLFRTLRTGWRDNIHLYWLNILLIGGAVFGLVDHAWNGELFLIGKNIILDIALGITITGAIIIAWMVLVVLDRTKAGEPRKVSH